MDPVAISAVGLSKRYRIPAPRTGQFPQAIGPRVVPTWARLGSGSDTWIEALADINFTISAGEAVGLLGANGAGKSTLLKVLSRVTRPTAGHADVYGRVGALIEVGTGFHPELTGRENTFLSGAILGMSRRDIGARFDDIVSFAEIHQFIDTPVKHYSSGMYARLGFAVAAYLKPAILIVDEILAVGDLGFQAKCLVHMRSLSRAGTTVLFVSHNLLAVADFCPRAMVFSQGRLLFDGPTSEAIAAYRHTLAAPRDAGSLDHQPAHEVRVNGNLITERFACHPNDPLQVDLIVDQPVDSPVAGVELNLVIETPDGRPAMHLRNDRDGTVLQLGPGRRTLTVVIEDLALAPGRYALSLRVVSLLATAPVIWDTDRIDVLILGDQRLGSIVQPRYRFEEHAGTRA